MSYIQLQASGVISTDRATLNGIETRQHPIRMGVEAAGLPAAWAQRGGAPYLAFTTTDDAQGFWTPNDRISRDVNATIRIVLANVAAETSKFCEFEIEHQSHDPGTLLAASGATINSGDIAVTDAQWTIIEHDFTLPFAEFAATDHGFGFTLTRTTPAGANAVGDIALLGCSVIYEIDR